MKETLKQVLGNVLLSALLGVGFYVVMGILGWGESRTGRYSGIEPHFIILGTFVLGLWSVRWMKQNPKREWIWGTVRAVSFLAIGSWFYTSATGITDLTIDPGGYSIPYLEGVVSVCGAGFACFLIAWAYTGIKRLFQRKPLNLYA